MTSVKSKFSLRAVSFSLLRKRKYKGFRLINPGAVALLQPAMIFLSHSGRDTERLTELVREMKRADIPIWFDQERIGLADSVSRRMSEGLKESDRILIAWSANAAGSEHVWNEIDAFYMTRPEPGRILFLCLDATQIPALYAARKYLPLDDVGRAIETIASWASGAVVPQIQEMEPSPSVPDELHVFPKGPRVRSHWITHDLVSAYAEIFGTQAKARMIIDKANQMRIAADASDPKVTYLQQSQLPSIGDVGAYAYWQEVFYSACLHSPRMLAALLLTQVDDPFERQAKMDRAALLNHMRSLNHS